MELKVYTIEETNQILKIHRTYVSRLIHDGKIRAIKVGRFYRILGTDLEKYIGSSIDKPLYKVEEAAKILKIHRLYVLRLIQQNKLKAIKIGKFYRISQDSLEKYIGEEPLTKVLTVDEVGKMMQLNRVTIINLINNKKLKAFKIGKFYRLTETMLASFLKVKEL